MSFWTPKWSKIDPKMDQNSTQIFRIDFALICLIDFGMHFGFLFVMILNTSGQKSETTKIIENTIAFNYFSTFQGSDLA